MSDTMHDLQTQSKQQTSRRSPYLLTPEQIQEINQEIDERKNSPEAQKAREEQRMKEITDVMFGPPRYDVF